MVVERHVWDALARVSDPEFPLSIVDLGMVYGVVVDKHRVTITMTFTSIGCPAIDMITDDIRNATARVPNLRDVDIDIVWDPPWTKDRISSTGRRILQSHGIAQ